LLDDGRIRIRETLKLPEHCFFVSKEAPGGGGGLLNEVVKKLIRPFLKLYFRFTVHYSKYRENASSCIYLIFKIIKKVSVS
jgi:hypothetical protein